MDILTEMEEKPAFEQLKVRCEDLKQDDITILRFLRAREGDVSKAEDMLRKSVEWRKVHQVETFLDWTPPKPITEDFKYSYLGEDNHGYATVYIPIGRWHIRDIIEDGYKEEAFQIRFKVLENIINWVNETQRYQFVIIFDMQECTYRKIAHTPTIQLLLAAFRDFEANYPERLHAAYVINAPWVFPYVYAMIKPLLSGRTLSKVKIFDGNVPQWKAALLERIPEESIPQECTPATG